MYLIKQIIPAYGWAAVMEEADGSHRHTTAKPLVCWALTEHGNIVGMIVNGEGVVDASYEDGFKSYDYDYDGTVTDYLMHDEQD